MPPPLVQLEQLRALEHEGAAELTRERAAAAQRLGEAGEELAHHKGRQGQGAGMGWGTSAAWGTCA